MAAWNGVCGVIFCLGGVMAGVNGCCTGTGGGSFDPSSLLVGSFHGSSVGS